jgi:hypothetical protein
MCYWFTGLVAYIGLVVFYSSILRLQKDLSQFRKKSSIPHEEDNDADENPLRRKLSNSSLSKTYSKDAGWNNKGCESTGGEITDDDITGEPDDNTSETFGGEMRQASDHELHKTSGDETRETTSDNMRKLSTETTSEVTGGDTYEGSCIVSRGLVWV